MDLDQKRKNLNIIADLVMTSEMRTVNALLILSILNQEKEFDNEC